MISTDQLKQLREETGAPISLCKEALEQAGGNLKTAKQIVEKLGREFYQKKLKKETKQGVIESYIHPGQKIGTMVELHCESDFVARSEEFRKLAHELCLQIAAISPEEIPLLEQPWIRDETKKIKDLVNEYITKFGENIVIEKFFRCEI